MNFIKDLELSELYTLYSERDSSDKKCPICGSSGKNIFKDIKRCSSCKTQYRLLDAKAELVSDVDYLKDLNIMMGHIIGRYLNPFKPVLEVGCGKGDLLNTLQEDYRAYITGLDINDNKRDGYKFPLYISRLENFDPPEIYDDVILTHVIEHFKDPVECLNKINSLLKPNGRVFIFTNEADNFPIGCIEDLLKNPTHQQLITEEGFKILAEKTGFKVVEYIRRWDYQIFTILTKI